MPRMARIVIEGYPHHVTQRGNNKQKAFLDEEDYQAYLEFFERYREKHNLGVLAYCPMPNHVHISACPENTDSLAKTLRSCHMRYAQYFNKKYKRVGHLWQCRFYSCAMEEIHLYSTVRYIENNPVRAKLVERAGDWEWSSYAVRNGSECEFGLSDGPLELPKNWNKLVHADIDKDEIKQLDNSIKRGAPLGNFAWAVDTAREMKLESTLKPRGRPRKGTGHL